MRCISPHPRYSIQVFEGNEQVMMDARGHAFSHVLKKPVIANFQQGGLLEHELEHALTRFNFSGIPEGVNPLTRIAVFDTEAYAEANDVSDEDLQAIDTKLRKLAEIHPSEFIVVDQPQADKPWDNYDGMSVEDVIFTRNLIGINPEKVRLYEIEHDGRPEIIDTMTALEEERAANGGEIVVQA